MVVERGRDGLLLVHNVIVADFVQFVGRDPGLDVRFDHFQDLGGEATRHAHFLDFVGRFYLYTHVWVSILRFWAKKRKSAIKFNDFGQSDCLTRLGMV
jgi:hypothetical protein